MKGLREKRKKLRQRKYFSLGTNYTWHIDGHDKLKPFSFSLHGCIYGFLRRLIWFKKISFLNKKSGNY